MTTRAAPVDHATWYLKVARHPVRLGVTGIALVAGALGAVYALVIPPFQPPDEASHMAFALELAHGEYPSIQTQPTHLAIPGMPTDHLTWVANHPPLYYLLAGLGLRAFAAAGLPLEGFYLVRLVNVLFGVATVVGVAWLARIITHRAEVVLGAAALGGLVPHFVSTTGFAYNDAVAVFAATAALIAAAAVLVHGPSWPRLCWLTLTVTFAIAFRSSGAAALVAGVGALGLGTLLHGWQPRREGRPADNAGPAWRPRLGPALVLTGGMTGVSLLLGGWAYLFNIGRYGSPTATGALMVLHGREPRGSTWSILAEGMFWRDLWGQLVSQIVEIRAIPDPRSVQAVALLALLGLIVAGVMGLVRYQRGDHAFDAGRFWAGVMLACYAAVIVFTLADFAAQGGSQHARYLYPAVGVIGLGLAVGLAALPYGRFTPWLLTAVGVWVVINGDRLRLFLVDAYELGDTTGVVTGLLHAFDTVGVRMPAVTLTTTVVVALLGLSAWVVACVRVGRAQLEKHGGRLPAPQRSL